MITPISNLSNDQVFRASWNDQLKYDNRLLWIAARKIKNLVLYVPNSILATVFNPRAQEIPYLAIRPQLTTPDNIPIAIDPMKQEDFTPDTPTVILFNPLGANSDFYQDLASKLFQNSCNILTFEYRGLGSTWRAKDFTVDGDSVYQYAVNVLKTKPENVHFYGTSLGGAVAAQVKSLHPESGKYVGDRVFKSVFSLISENCCISRLGTLVKRVTSLVSAIFIAFPVRLLGWEFDGTKAKLGKETLGIYHPNDCLIPTKASLTCQFENKVRLDSTQKGAMTHFSPIQFHKEDQSDRKAIDSVVKFLSPCT